MKELFDSIAPQIAENRTIANLLSLFLKNLTNYSQSVKSNRLKSKINNRQ